LIQTKTTT